MVQNCKLKKMDFFRLIFFVLSLIFLPFSNALNIKIYRDFSYKGLIYEFEGESGGCIDIEEFSFGVAGSVRSDTCVISFENGRCTGLSTKLQPGTPEMEMLMRRIESFKPCEKTAKIQAIFQKGGETLAEYMDICGCQSIPAQVSAKADQISNNPNCLKVYQTESCGGLSKEIPGGNTLDSKNLRRLGFYTRSISACGDKPTCVKLNSKVFRFELFFDEARNALKASTATDVELAAKTTFYNNGSATVIQEYEAEKTISEAYEITESSSTKEVSSSTVETKVETKTETKINAIFVKISVTVTKTLTTALTFEKTEENTEETTHRSINEKKFSIRQAIEVPPCTQYEVSSMVSVMEKVPVVYDVYSRVTADSAGLPLSVDEIKRQVSHMTWVEDYDDFTAIYKSRSILYADVGLDTWITGEGTTIANCFLG